VLSGPGGVSGLFERRWDAATRTLELTYAFREDLPAWIDAGRPLVPGKGVPTQMYTTLRMMKQFGIGLGEVRLCRMVDIHEVESVAHLAWLRKRQPATALGELVQHTHSYLYARSSMLMSGHHTVGVRLDDTRAEQRPIGDLCAHYEAIAVDSAARRAEHDGVLAKYGLTRDDVVLFGYDVLIKTEPRP
jgi:hypothetical protein